MPPLCRPLCFLLSSLFISAALAQTAPPSGSSPARADGVIKTVALIIGEPNYSIDNAYQELEEGFYSAPELFDNGKVFAPINEILPALGGTAEIDTTAQSARFSLAGKTLSLKAGSLDATVDGKTVQTDIAPQWRKNNLWVSVHWVFEQFGAYAKWDKARKRYTASLTLPVSKKTEGIAKGGSVVHNTLLKQPASFWKSPEGIQVADVILGYQNPDGGWPKLEDDSSLTKPINRAALSGFKAKSTLDNDATNTEITALARAYRASGEARFREGFDKGLEYLFSAQMDNGGWPQYWPEPQGYKAHITFNDGAISNAMEVLYAVSRLDDAFAFVTPLQARRATAAFDAGLRLILRTQIRIDGKRTGWSAQYDENTLAPAAGRGFELASISGGESVSVVRTLMMIDKPSPAVIQAVQDAIAWFDSAKLTGLKRVRHEDPTLEYGFDFAMEKTGGNDLTWARFYDLEKGRPLFARRDGTPRTRFEDVSYERRVKYNWYTTEATSLLSEDYPAWIKRLGLKSVLARH